MRARREHGIRLFVCAQTDVGEERFRPGALDDRITGVCGTDSKHTEVDHRTVIAVIFEEPSGVSVVLGQTLRPCSRGKDRSEAPVCRPLARLLKVVREESYSYNQPRRRADSEQLVRCRPLQGSLLH